MHWNSVLSTASFKRVSATDIVAGFLILALGTGLMPVFSDPGSGWHLKTGQLILESGTIPSQDPFLSPQLLHPWINDQWLGDLVLGLIERVFGMNGVFVFVVGICSLSFFVLLRRLIDIRTKSILVAVVVFLMAALTASVQFICRPLVFSMFLLVCLHSIFLDDLNRERLSRFRYFLILPIIFALWANLHGAFTLGLLLVALFFLHRLIASYPNRAKMWNVVLFGAGCGLLSGLATLLNPWGIKLWMSVLGLASSRYFMNLNTEWLPLDLFSPIFIAPLTLVVLFLFAPRPPGCFRRHCYEFLLASAFMALSLLHRRYMVFLPIALAPLISLLYAEGFLAGVSTSKAGPLSRLVRADRNLSARFHGTTGGLVVTAVAFLVMTVAVSFGYKEDLRGFTASYPRRIAEHLRNVSEFENPTIFATPDYGGYLVYQLWPRYRVYIDDRNQLIGEDRYKEYFGIISIRQHWRETLNSTGADYLILGENMLLTRLLQRGGLGWIEELRDSDSKNILFKKES